VLQGKEENILREPKLTEHTAVRLVTGAFPTRPVISLCAEVAEPPLNFRRLHLTANFLASTAQFPHLPIFDHLFLTQKLKHFHSHPHLNIRLNFEKNLNSLFNFDPLPPILTLTPSGNTQNLISGLT